MNHTEAIIGGIDDPLKEELTIKFTFEGNSNGPMPEAEMNYGNTDQLNSSLPKAETFDATAEALNSVPEKEVDSAIKSSDGKREKPETTLLLKGADSIETTLREVYDMRDVPKKLKKLLSKLLKKKPEKRLKAKDLLKDKWVKGKKPSSRKLTHRSASKGKIELE